MGIGWDLNRVSTSYLMVPFPSPMEAEMASRLLMPHVQSQEGAGVKELTVSDNHLTVLVLKRAMLGAGGGGGGGWQVARVGPQRYPCCPGPVTPGGRRESSVRSYHM